MDPRVRADNPRSMVTGPRRQNADERGTALIEFALVFPLLLVLTLTVVDCRGRSSSRTSPTRRRAKACGSWW